MSTEIDNMTEDPSATPRLPLTAILAWLVFCAAFATAWYPVLANFVLAWYGSDDFSHGFLIAPLAGYMAWQRRDRFVISTERDTWLGLGLAVVSLFAFLFAQIGEILTLGSLSLITFIWGAVIFLFGLRTFRAALYPLLFLLFMVPVPSQIYTSLTMPLQLLVSKATVVLAQQVGIPVYRDGNVIHLPDQTFQVVQACSGLRSIMTMLTLGAVMGFFTLRSSLARGVLILAGVPISIAINIIRVLALVAAHHYFALNLAEGTPHTILGIAVFVVAFILFLGIQKGLDRCER